MAEHRVMVIPTRKPEMFLAAVMDKMSVEGWEIVSAAPMLPVSSNGSFFLGITAIGNDKFPASYLLVFRREKK